MVMIPPDQAAVGGPCNTPWKASTVRGLSGKILSTAAIAMAVVALGPASPALAASAPSAAGNLTAATGDGAVTLHWNASSGAPSGYYVWRTTPRSAWTMIASLPASTLTYEDRAVTNGSTYTYGIRAYNGSGVSASSNLVTAVPAGSTPPSTPSTPPTPPASQTRCGAGSAYQNLISSTPGLAGYWRLGDITGATACEMTGRNDGAYTGGYTLGTAGALPGDPDLAAAFNGTTGHVRVPDSPSLSLGDSFSVEAWVKRASISTSSNQVIASKQSGSWVLMFNSQNQLVLRRSNVDDVAASTTAVTDTAKWHHVVATKNGANVHLYIDGADVTGPVSNQTMVDNTNPLVIGQSSATAFFGGAIDEVAVYSGALTPSQVTDHFRAGGQASGGQPASTDPVIAAAGDIACSASDAAFNGGLGTDTECRQLATSDLLVNAGLSAVLPLGDNQYGGAALSAFNSAYATSWGRVKSISHPIAGNHEYDSSSSATGYFDYFNGPGASNGPAGPRGKGWYSWDVGDWHMIALNSECSYVGGCGVGSAQEQWLRADLAAHPARCTLAYWHKPLFNSGYTGNATETRPLWQDLYDAGADVVLNGHSHTYERFAPQTANGGRDSARGIREFVVGTGGEEHHALGTMQPNSESVNANTFGVLRMTLHAGSYDWRFVPEAGRSFTDSGSASCH
jgi:hypothetical protein